MIAAYRNQRLADERKEDKKGRFGRVYPIGREDYTREVTEASNVDEDDDDNEKGTGVVCFLYKDGWVAPFRSLRNVCAERLDTGYQEAIAHFNTFTL